VINILCTYQQALRLKLLHHSHTRLQHSHAAISRRHVITAQSPALVNHDKAGETVAASDVEVGEVVRGGHFERASAQAGVNGSVRDNWHTPVGQWNSHELIDPLCLGGIGRVYSHSNVAKDSLGSGGGHQEELLLRGG
jgi:hypothetical protein